MSWKFPDVFTGPSSNNQDVDLADFTPDQLVQWRLYGALRWSMGVESGFDKNAVPEAASDFASSLCDVLEAHVAKPAPGPIAEPASNASEAKKKAYEAAVAEAKLIERAHGAAYFLGVLGLLKLDGISDPAAGADRLRTALGDTHLTWVQKRYQEMSDIDLAQAAVTYRDIGQLAGAAAEQVRRQYNGIVRIMPSFHRHVADAVREYNHSKLLYRAVVPIIAANSSDTISGTHLAGVVRRLAERGISHTDLQLDLHVKEALGAMVGGRVDGRAASIEIDLPSLDEEENDNIVADNVIALSALYYGAMLEDMKLFKVADKIADLFEKGAIPVSKGPAGQDLYDFIRAAPDRFTEFDRRGLYGRAFGLAMGSVEVETQNREFKDLWLRFLSSASRYRRQAVEQHQEVTLEGVAKSANDLAVNLSLHGYGIGYFAAVEIQALVRNVLNFLRRPEILSAFGATTVWQLVERVSEMYLGGAVNGVQHRTMATSGQYIIEWLGRHSKQLGPHRFETASELEELYAHIERWLAVGGFQHNVIVRNSEPVMTNQQPTIPSWSLSGLASAEEALNQLTASIPEAK